MTEAISAIGSVESVMEAAHKSTSSPATEQLSEKFAALMQAPGAAQAAPPMSAAEPNSLMRVMETQEGMFKQTVADMKSFHDNADLMSMNEVAAEQTRLTLELATSSVYFQFGSQVAQDANKSLQTLLKNQ
jgi:type III secretion system HrpB2-like protein